MKLIFLQECQDARLDHTSKVIKDGFTRLTFETPRCYKESQELQNGEIHGPSLSLISLIRNNLCGLFPNALLGRHTFDFDPFGLTEASVVVSDMVSQGILLSLAFAVPKGHCVVKF